MDPIDIGQSEDTSSTPRRCLNCNSHVTRNFARVFGDNGNRVYRCQDCSESEELCDGAAAAGRADFDR